MKELVLDAVPTDERASVDISDTALETGENTVTVAVSTGVEAVQYFLHVTRPEAELLPEMAPEQEAVSEPETVSAPKAALESGTEGERPEEDNPQTIAETESLFVPAMAQPAADPGWRPGTVPGRSGGRDSLGKVMNKVIVFTV